MLLTCGLVDLLTTSNNTDKVSLMKIYTRTGDEGKTSLLAGGRVDKFSLRVETYGTFDELNSWLGYCRSLSTDALLSEKIAGLQEKIHTLCSDAAAEYEGDFSLPSIPRVKEEWTELLEKGIDEMEADLPQLENFILPGGTQAGAALHIARTVCRRGERLLHRLNLTEGKINPAALKFVNRLSDYLFTLARWGNVRGGVSERIWKWK